MTQRQRDTCVCVFDDFSNKNQNFFLFLRDLAYTGLTTCGWGCGGG